MINILEQFLSKFTAGLVMLSLAYVHGTVMWEPGVYGESMKELGMVLLIGSVILILSSLIFLVAGVICHRRGSTEKFNKLASKSSVAIFSISLIIWCVYAGDFYYHPS